VSVCRFEIHVNNIGITAVCLLCLFLVSDTDDRGENMGDKCEGICAYNSPQTFSGTKPYSVKPEALWRSKIKTWGSLL
jgi:hypothetical protein